MIPAFVSMAIAELVLACGFIGFSLQLFIIHKDSTFKGDYLSMIGTVLDGGNVMIFLGAAGSLASMFVVAVLGLVLIATQAYK
ncbi:hypothetical protein JNJ66_05260 [Candidatus Saccharibacteria bacterium]|nr:hypothetical protein [Candidatus Saccharibacteria bacterium]